MPFGLSPAPRAFTKLIKPLLVHFRDKRVRIVASLDDFLILNESKDELISQVSSISGTFEAVGFMINREKSIADPAQTIEFLGFVLEATSN